MAKQQNIIKNLHAGLVNCPPSRLKVITSEAFNNVTDKQLLALQSKLEVVQQLIKNQLQLRKNKIEDLVSLPSISDSDRKLLIKYLASGKLNSSLI